MLLHKIVRKNISIPLAAPADGMQPPTFNHGRITCEQTVISILKTLDIDSKVDNKRNAKETQIDGRVRHPIFSQTLKALAKYVRSSLKMLSIDSKVDNKRRLPDKLNKHAKETQIDGRVTYSGCSTTLHTNMSIFMFGRIRHSRIYIQSDTPVLGVDHGSLKGLWSQLCQKCSCSVGGSLKGIIEGLLRKRDLAVLCAGFGF